MEPRKVRGSCCLNCGTALDGRFCAACGQAADVRIVTLREFLAELLGDLFALDSRIWRSLLPLLLRPGFLTSEFLAGRRQHYLPPFRMYLVLSLLFFVSSSLLSPGNQVIISPDPEVMARLADEAQRQDPDARVIRPIEISEEELAKLPRNCGDLVLELPAPFDSAEWQQRTREACEQMAADNGDSFGKAVTGNIPTMMFLFIPLVAFFMFLIYPLTGRKFVEHLLFLLHVHAFYFLLLTLFTITGPVTSLLPGGGVLSGLLELAGWIYVPVYVFLAMLRVYGQGLLLTALKFMLLSMGYLVTLGVSVVATIVYTIFSL